VKWDGGTTELYFPNSLSKVQNMPSSAKRKRFSTHTDAFSDSADEESGSPTSSDDDRDDISQTSQFPEIL
jgi:hypothetical protein